jgi:diguanylate cyclase (GGDEF)-like protein
MDSVLPLRHGLGDPDDVLRALVRSRGAYYEEPADALAEAIRCHEIARSLGRPELCARALALQGSVSLHRGDLRSGLALAVEAERHSEPCGDLAARAEVAALKAQISFFTGSYSEALSHAELAIELADRCGDVDLQIFARRATCVVFGNVGVRDWGDRLAELLALTVARGDRWEEAISRNDLACYHHELGDADAAESEIERALEAARGVASSNSFALALIYSSRADVRLLAGRPRDALADAERAIGLLVDSADPNPYVLGVTVRAEVQALMALGHFDDARETGEDALGWLGDRVPQTRSLILSTLAEALREAGRLEDAYEALARAAELERQAFRELSELQLSLERSALETRAARRESDSLAQKNRQLAEAHAELERRTNQLESLQDQLRDQAERDWLTGLHNRRYLARELERLAQERRSLPLSLAILDLDHFKSINDRFGHEAGDQVLIRVARLLCDVLRASDTVVRSGGEEFVILMPSTDDGAATACCERIRAAIRAEAWGTVAAGLDVSASVGVAGTEDPDDLEALIRLADQRLYDAKRTGRDRVVGPPERLSAV